MTMQPIARIINQNIADGSFLKIAVNNGNLQHLTPVGGIDDTTIPIGLLLITLTSLDSYFRVRSKHMKILHRREIGGAQKRNRPGIT